MDDIITCCDSGANLASHVGNVGPDCVPAWSGLKTEQIGEIILGPSWRAQTVQIGNQFASKRRRNETKCIQKGAKDQPMRPRGDSREPKGCKRVPNRPHRDGATQARGMYANSWTFQKMKREWEGGGNLEPPLCSNTISGTCWQPFLTS